MSRSSHREHALAIFRAGVAAADPEPLTARAMPDLDGKRVHVVAAGKAAPAMARGALSALGAAAAVEGTLLVPEGLDASGVEPLVVRAVRPAGRNEATPEAVEATLAVLTAVSALGPGDVLLGLFSGGGSATLAAPWPGIPLADQLAAVRVLDEHGAPIAAVNTLRRHLSRVKGGRLALAAGSADAVVSLLLSDVDGDAPEAIASGPCVADPTTFRDALDELDAHEALDGLPETVRRHLDRGERGELDETPKALPDNVTHVVVGSPANASRGAAREALRLGYTLFELDRGADPATHMSAVRGSSEPSCVVSAGEWTVALPAGAPPGGRAGHFALALAIALDADPMTRGHATVLCGATDGEDGTSGTGGALIDATRLYAAETAGLDPARMLARGESLAVLHAAGAVLPAGATGTNVQDLRVVLVS